MLAFRWRAETARHGLLILLELLDKHKVGRGEERAKKVRMFLSTFFLCLNGINNHMHCTCTVEFPNQISGDYTFA